MATRGQRSRRANKPARATEPVPSVAPRPYDFRKLVAFERRKPRKAGP